MIRAVHVRRAAALGMVLGFAPMASAQFVYGITRPTFGAGPVDVYFQDVDSGSAGVIFNPETAGLPATAPGFNGLAADEAGQRLFGSIRNGPDDDLYTLDYATLTPHFVGEVTIAGTTQKLAIATVSPTTPRQACSTARASSAEARAPKGCTRSIR